MRRLHAIVVTDKNWGIGKDGKLLVHLPGDLKFFKEKTLGNIVIMGRKTLLSLPGAKPLPGRTTIIMTSNKELKGDFYTVSSIDDLSSLLDDFHTDKPHMIPYVAGGASIYGQLLQYTDTCVVTRMNRAFDADTFFPNLDMTDDFKLTSESAIRSENDVDYRFTEYKRIKE